MQASEDARKLVDEERAFARAEIEAARAAVQRVEEALQEQERMSRASGKQVCMLCLFQFSSGNFLTATPLLWKSFYSIVINALFCTYTRRGTYMIL